MIKISIHMACGIKLKTTLNGKLSHTGRVPPGAIEVVKRIGLEGYWDQMENVWYPPHRISKITIKDLG